MLKRFFLNFLSSFTAVLVAMAAFTAVAVIVVIALIGKFGSKTVSVEKHSVYLMSLSGFIDEGESGLNVDAVALLTSGQMPQTQCLHKMIAGLEEARTNKNIDVVFIRCEGAMASPATLHALRQAVVDFRKNCPNKKVIAYADTYTQGDFYVASAASEVYLNPMGVVDLHGIGGQSIYMKDLFDKIGVEFQVAKVGTFKSAVEPFIMNEMSDPARHQLDTLYGEMWDVIKNGFAADTHISPANLDSLINSNIPMLNDAEFAKRNKLVTDLKYEEEVNDMLKEICHKKKKEDDLNFVDYGALLGQSQLVNNSDAGNQVAVLIASGEISEMSESGINCYNLVPEIYRLAEDDNVKALVMRVNSPGGSVFGSEQIWKALEDFKATGKPYYVSMGDYAASGGYYISCGAQKIYADSLTVTGSIGIFGLFPNFAKLEEKIGINAFTVSTNPSAMIDIPLKPLTSFQMEEAQRMVERGYDLFTGRVAEGRNMTQAEVKAIGEGRVWSAVRAKELGLVDELGSLRAAVKAAAEQAGIGDNYKTVYYPEVSPFDLAFLTSMAGAEVSVKLEGDYAWIRSIFGTELTDYSVRQIHSVLYRKPIQARMADMRILL